jgi:hypothetical protein
LENIKVYVKIDSNNRINDIDAEWNIDDLSDWVLIDGGVGDKYYNAQSKYFHNPLMNLNTTHNYIYENNTVRETTDEEKAMELASFPTPEPTETEKLQQQLDAILLALVEV